MDQLLQPYFDFWSNCYDQANEQSRRLLEDAQKNLDARQWQRRWSEAVRESADAYMRSPAFLHGMKKNMDATVKAKLQADEIRKEFVHKANIPTADDISDVLERLRAIEQLFLVRFSEMEQRLAVIEERLAEPGS